jgi:hypothetical protein
LFINHGIRIIWVDKKSEFYDKQGMNIKSVEYLSNNKNNDLIIAILDETVADRIQNNLVKEGYNKEKIHWLDLEILNKLDLNNVFTNMK